MVRRRTYEFFSFWNHPNGHKALSVSWVIFWPDIFSSDDQKLPRPTDPLLMYLLVELIADAYERGASVRLGSERGNI